MSDDVVWTSRRALLRTSGRTWTPGRLRVTDRALRFTARSGAEVEVPRSALGAVRATRLPRRCLVLETPDGVLRLRCFAVPAIAALLTFHGSGRIPDSPSR